MSAGLILCLFGSSFHLALLSLSNGIYSLLRLGHVAPSGPRLILRRVIFSSIPVRALIAVLFFLHLLKIVGLVYRP